MKNLGLVLFLLWFSTAPILAVEYRGRNLDGKKLAAKAYYYATGGVYEVQVRFEQQRATIYFTSGSQIVIQLQQSIITDLDEIEGFGKPGYFPLARDLSIGLELGENQGGSQSEALEGFWRISLDPSEVNQKFP